MTPEAGLTLDRFLNGRVTVHQPRDGYRAGLDAVLLAAAVPARPGEHVLELGCGAGTAFLCLAARVGDLSLSALEVQPEYATLARRNAVEAGLSVDVHVGDVAAPPRAIRALRVDHVFANPPFFARTNGVAARDSGREAGRGETAPLAAWVDCAARRLRHSGSLTLVQRTERLPDILAAMVDRFGALEILPLAGRAGQEAERVIVRGRLGRRTPLRLLPPLVLHPGATHAEDAGAFRAEVDEVLRNVAPLPGLATLAGD